MVVSRTVDMVEVLAVIVLGVGGVIQEQGKVGWTFFRRKMFLTSHIITPDLDPISQYSVSNCACLASYRSATSPTSELLLVVEFVWRSPLSTLNSTIKSKKLKEEQSLKTRKESSEYVT